MNFFELVSQRESCRNYTGEAVSTRDLEKIIETARLAPSACNAQPWYFYVVTEKEKRESLAASMQAFTKKAGAFIVIVEDKTSLPVKFANTVKKQNLPLIDIGIVASHICFSATALNLSSCMIGWYQEKKIRQTLGLKASARIRLVISIGHAVKNPIRPKKRKTLESIYTMIK